MTPETDPNQFYKPKLLGGSVEFDVLMDDSNCGCVQAFHTVLQPGKNEDGSFRPNEDNSYYCDANKVGGNFCPEFDIMEGN
jgi:hypothetical protein